MSFDAAPPGDVPSRTPTGMTGWPNAFPARTGAALLRYGSLPDMTDGTPGMFAQSDPTVIEAVLRSAGLHDVHVEPIIVTLRLGSNAVEATQYLADSGVGRAVLETIDEQDRALAMAAVVDTLGAYEGDDGVHLEASINIIHAWVER